MDSIEGLHYSGAAGAEMDMETISRAFFSPDHPAGSGSIHRSESKAIKELLLPTRGIFGAGFQDKREQPWNLTEAEGDSWPLRGTCLEGNSAFGGELYQEFGPSAHGGFVVVKRLESGGITRDLPPPEAEGATLPERMALALHALRLAGLKLDAKEPRCNLVLEADQAAYFESICRASGIEVPLPESSNASHKTYADAAPLNAKPPLAFYSRRI